MSRTYIEESSRHCVLYIMIFCSVFLISSCTGDDQDSFIGPDDWANMYDWSDPDTWLEPYNWSDKKVISFAYTDYRVPPEFYTEDRDGGSPYYENTISIRRPICPDEGCWFELCSDDRDMAYAWSESTAVNGSYYRDYESELETEKYFEFRRVYELNPRDVLLSRVHKCSYLDRTMYDRLHPTPVLGLFVPKPITIESSRELVEYMWVNDMLPGHGRVISCSSSEKSESFSHLLLYVSIVYGDFGICDRITLIEMVVDVATGSGSITWNSQVLREMNGICR